MSESRTERVEIEVGTVSVTFAARRLGIGRGTAYVLARQGRLPGARRLGRRFVVSKRELERFLDGDGGEEAKPFSCAQVKA